VQLQCVKTREDQELGCTTNKLFTDVDNKCKYQFLLHVNAADVSEQRKEPKRPALTAEPRLVLDTHVCVHQPARKVC